MISMNPMISMISKTPQSYFDKFGAIKRILGPFPKNVGLFPKNDGHFLRSLPRFFFYFLVFFRLRIATKQSPCVKVVKAKSAKSL